MIARLLRSAFSLLIVLVCYTAYALVAVPLIEPDQPDQPAIRLTKEQRRSAQNVLARYQDVFKAYFPAAHWAHQHPMVIESKQAMLVVDGQEMLEDNLMQLSRCAVIFFPQTRADDDAAPSQAVILEAPQGALLRFEDGFDLTSAKIERLVQGQLKGQITIRSDMRQPGPDDDLHLVTHDVQFNDSRVWTNRDVQFRVGPNTGHGSELEIRLLPKTTAGTKAAGAMNIGGMQSLALKRNVKAHFELGKLMPGRDPDKPPQSGNHPPNSGLPGAGKQPPFEITCQGPFHFNMVRNVATFEDQVDVLRLNPNGPSDQMVCELLSIHFQPKQQDAAPKKSPAKKNAPPPSVQPLEPTMIVAEGNPVRVFSPSTGSQARGRRLKYDLKKRKISIEGREAVELLDGPNAIYAPAIDFQPSDQPGRLGTVWAAGPGWLRAAREDNPAQKLEVRWSGQLHLRRYEGQPVLSITGKPQLIATGLDQNTSQPSQLIVQPIKDAGEGSEPTNGELHVWLLEHDAPTAGQAGDDRSLNVTLDKMMAKGDVRIDSPSLTGQTRQLEVWFKHMLSPNRSSPGALATAGGRQPRPTNSFAAISRPAPTAPAQQLPPEQTFHVRGRHMRLGAVIQDKQAEVTDVTLHGDVHFSETKTARPDDEPLVIRGDQLEVSSANTEARKVVVIGRPGNVRARGLSIESAIIHLDQGANRLWIDDAGTTTFPLSRSLSGESLARPQSLTVDWQGRMQFDGRTVHFERAVSARSEHTSLQTEVLDVELREKVLFSESVPSEQLGEDPIAQITCKGGVDLENRSFKDGARQSVDRFHTRDLKINQITGQLFAAGPGWLTSVRTGNGDSEQGGFPALGNSAPRTPRAARNDGTPEPQIRYLRIDFSRYLDGSLGQRHREINFHGDTRTVYGPVLDWNQTIDADDPDGLSKGSLLLTSDRLSVIERNPPPKGRGPVELQALSNVVAEGNQFTAHGYRLEYVEDKGRMLLVGDGTSFAQLVREEYVGSPRQRLEAQQILYWPSTNQTKVHNSPTFDLNQIRGPTARATPR